MKRHLNHEPVTAAAPSTSCRLGKFVRRHRQAVALAIGKRRPGVEALLLANTQTPLGKVLVSLDRPAEAEAPLCEALRLRQGLPGEAHPEIAESRGLLAEALERQGKRTAAAAAAREAKRVFEKRANPLHQPSEKIGCRHPRR